MPENYEVIYTHPSGATATFIRQSGELDALAKGLDAEQFWVFKNVKSLLVRNDIDDLAEANRLMAAAGFSHTLRVLTAPTPATAPARAPVAAPVATAALAAEEHHGPHLPDNSYWPFFLACSVALAWVGILVMEVTPIIIAIGLVLVFYCIVRWGLEPA